MSNAPSLHWLPPDEYWRQRLKAFITADGESGERWADAISLANCRLDFAMTNALDAAVRKIFGTSTSTGFDGPTARLALLTTSTGAHLHPGDYDANQESQYDNRVKYRLVVFLGCELDA